MEGRAPTSNRTEAEELFLAAISIPAEERAAWFAAQSAAPEVRHEAERMLRAIDASGERIDAALGAMARDVLESTAQGSAGAGRYVLLHALGEGSFGQVFLGRQEQPVRRLVAVKVLREALASPSAVARFRAERQVMAALDHPGIAAMLDSGELPDGRPWFAMPFVAGLPVTDWARERSLDLRARVLLMASVCDAVEHAHRRGVIHRDLKPGNVIVAEDDAGHPRPRVIDFGVAKALDATFAEPDARTVDGAILGTPEYMPPEQAEGRAPDTRNDAFAVGVMLYELVAGRLPRDGASLRAGGRAGLAPAIRRIRAAPPSAVAPGQGIDGDLDAVCMKAIDADPEARYQSVAELRADLLRWLDGEATSASAPSRIRALRRFVRRHRASTAAAAIVATALVVATTVSVRAAALATAARDEATAARAQAERRAEQNERVLDYLSGMLAGADPTAQEGRTDVTVRETLETAVRDLDAGALRGAPVEEAETRQSLGDAFAGIGRPDDAVAQYERALGLLDGVSAAAGGATDDSGAGVDRLAVGLATKASAVLANAQRGAEARVFAERAVRSAGTAAVRGLALTALADALRIEGKDLAAARAAAEESVEILRGDPAMRGELAAALNNLGIVLQDVGEVEPGIVALEEAVAINAEVGADRTYKAMYELHNLSALQRTAGRMPEAERHARSALAIVERLAGNDHPHRATVLANLALALRGQRRLEEAEAVQREGLATLERAGLGSGPDAGIAWLNLASLLRDRADLPGAIEAGRRAVEVLDAIPGQDAWLRAAARMSFGRALSAAGQHAEAEPPLREAWELLEPMPIDARRRSAGLLALFQACRAWNEQDPEAMPDDRVEQLRSAVREFDAANPGVIPAGSW